MDLVLVLHTKCAPSLDDLDEASECTCSRRKTETREKNDDASKRSAK